MQPDSDRPARIDYNRIAGEYAANRRIHAGVFQNLLEVGRVEPGSRLLEVGSGTGNYIIALQETTGCAAWGVDPSEGMLAQALARESSVRFGPGQAELLPFGDGFFDLIYSVDVIHHVQDKPAGYREMFRALKPGGRISTVTDSEDIIRRREPLASYFPETVEVELRRYPPVADLRAWMTAAGFTHISEVVVETRRELQDIRPYREKAFSSLHLISEEAFRQGIARMEADLRSGPLPWVSRYVLVWGDKPGE